MPNQVVEATSGDSVNEPLHPSGQSAYMRVCACARSKGLIRIAKLPAEVYTMSTGGSISNATERIVSD